MPLARSTAALLLTLPCSAAAALPPPPPVAPSCVRTLTAAMPTSTAYAWDVSLRNGTVLFGRTHGWASSPPVHLEVFDLATATFAALTPAIPGVAEWGPTFVDDAFIVYQRVDANIAVSEMRAHWIGPDGVWASADDVDWAFDSAPNGVPYHGAFSDPHANEGEVAYVHYGANDLRTCDVFASSTQWCLPGTVTSRPQSTPATFAHPVPGATLVDRYYPLTDWLYPAGNPTPWIAERVADTWGPLVLSDNGSLVGPPARLNVSLAVDPPLPPLWVVPTQWGVGASFSPTSGSNGGLRVAFRDLNDVGVVADLGTSVSVASVTGRAYSIGVDGDDVAYATVPQGGWLLELAVDACIF